RCSQKERWVLLSPFDLVDHTLGHFVTGFGDGLREIFSSHVLAKSYRTQTIVSHAVSPLFRSHLKCTALFVHCQSQIAQIVLSGGVFITMAKLMHHECSLKSVLGCDSMEIVGQRLRRLRQRRSNELGREVTAAEVASAVGVSKSSMYMYER